MVSLIFVINDIEILVILPYISSYFITQELYIRPSNTNTRNNDPIQNNNNNKNDNNNDDDDDDDNNNDFNSNILFSHISECYYCPRCYMQPTGKKRCYKITTDHN